MNIRYVPHPTGRIPDDRRWLHPTHRAGHESIQMGILIRTTLGDLGILRFNKVPGRARAGFPRGSCNTTADV